MKNKMLTIGVLLTAGAVLAAGTCAAAAKPLGFAKLNEISKSGDRNYVFIIAHRAIAVPSERIPENSLAAVKRAIELGADIIEVDPKTTKDRRVILSHEGKNLGRIMQFAVGVDGNATVQDIPYESDDPQKPCFKTAKLRVSREDPTPTDERPCTWEELLDACKGKCFIHADCSYWNMMPDYRLIWDPIVARGMQDQVLFNVEKGHNQYIMSPGQPTPAGMRGFFWDAFSWDSKHSADAGKFGEILATEGTSGRRIELMPIGMYGHNLTGDWGDRASMDVDPRVGWAKLLDLGATVLMTDYPEELRNYLEKAGRRTPKAYKGVRVIPEQVQNSVWDGSCAPGLCSKKVKLPRPGTCWCDGTTGEKEIWWNVTLPKSGYKGGSYGAYLADHKWRVESSPFATGGDIVLKYAEAGKDHYVHVFTNGTSTLEFKKPVTARVLAVGGGGGAGKGSKLHGPWDFQTAGGGSGGSVVDKSGLKMSGAYTVTVGKGGAPRQAGGESSVVKGASKIVARGGAAGADGKEGADGRSGDGAGAKGAAGFNARGDFPGGGAGLRSDIFRERISFGGGGAAGTHSGNGGGTYRIRGGLGGGGSSSSDSYNNKNHYSEPGTDGLGGGGAGGQMRGTDANLVGSRGGDGIVVISY